MGFEEFDIYEVLSMYRRRYIFALLAVALLAVGAFTANYSVIHGQKEDGVRINIAGRQRMLSQRMALLATMRQQSASPERRAALDADLVEMRQLFERSHRALLEGDAGLGLKRRAQDASFYELYFGEPELDRHVEEYLEDVDAIIALPDGRAVPPALLDRMHANAMVLLPLLDRATSWHEAQSTAHVSMLFWTEVAILLLMLVVLVLEALLIFRPMDDTLHTQLETIRADGIALERASRRMKILLDSTGDGVVTLTGDGRFGELHNQQFEDWFGEVEEGSDAINVLFAQDRTFSETRDLFMIHGRLNHLIALAANLPGTFESNGQTFSLTTHYTYEPEPRLMLILKDHTSERGIADARETLEAKEQLFSNMLQAMCYPLGAIEDQARQILANTTQDQGQQCAANIIVLTRQLLVSTEDPIQLSDMRGGQLVFTPSVFVLEELIEDVINVLAAATTLQDNTVQTVIEPGLATVYTDRVKVFHLLMNILSKFNTLTDHGVLRLVMRTQHRQTQKCLLCEVVCRNRRTYSAIKKIKPRDVVWHKLFAQGALTASDLSPETVLNQKLCSAIGAELFERQDEVEGVCYRLIVPINSSAASLHIERSGTSKALA